MLKNLEITIETAQKLVQEQFPKWADLEIETVPFGGWDNRTFRLGREMLLRLPSAKCYEPQIQKEHLWLPKLRAVLPFVIPEPLAMGRPSRNYPWHWSVYRWIDGESANTLSASEVQTLAEPLAHCLKHLHAVDATNGPRAGTHNFYRGGTLSVYDHETRNALARLNGIIDVASAASIWKEATSSEWLKTPVWVHGDVSAGNLLVKDGRLAAMIDFGCLAVGDPACDLVMAWTDFTGQARTLFKSILQIDELTWNRAKGWALWKALITLAACENRDNPKFKKAQQVINELTHTSQVPAGNERSGAAYRP